MIWIVGAGPMAAEYIKVLRVLDRQFLVIGRSDASAVSLEAKENVEVIRGGIEKYLQTMPELPDKVIVSTGVEALLGSCKSLIHYGVKSILVEKPGALSSLELKEMAKLSSNSGAKVYVAYNRRFYASVLEAQKIIEQDGGVVSFNFEITEWSHIIENNLKDGAVMQSWFLANTSHVTDLAWYLGGKPKVMKSYQSGSLSWHQAASRFSGAGISESGALFSYFGDWSAPGRWALEISTLASRLIFRPLEQLSIQKIGSVKIESVPFDNKLDTEFKPGIYKQIDCFLNDEDQILCSLKEQIENARQYEEMAGYNIDYAKA